MPPSLITSLFIMHEKSFLNPSLKEKKFKVPYPIM